MTVKLFQDDPYLLTFEATVRSRREHEGRPAVVLDQTAFYAESGGQPWDTGTLSGVPVVAVVEHEGEILHVLGGPLLGDQVAGTVDGERRRDHREQHHGQHLLSRAFVEAARARTVSFHLGAELSSIDLDREVGDAEVAAAEAMANEVIWSARPVGVRILTRGAAEAEGLKVPPEAGDAVRVVDAQGFDAQPCGGTHPRNTAEVGCVVVVGKERYKAGSRIRFLCGHRVIDAFRARRGILEKLSAALSAPIDGLPEAVDRTAAQGALLARQVKDLREQSVGYEADRLAAAASGDPAIIVAVYDGWGPGELRALASGLTSRRKAVVLLGGRSDKAYVALGQSEGLGHDLGPWLQQALQAVDGKGGGRGNLVQGAGPRIEALGSALDRLAEAIRTSLGAR